MSSNLFEEYVNSLDAAEKPSSSARMENIQIETWEGKIIDCWREAPDVKISMWDGEIIGTDDKGMPILLCSCQVCGKRFCAGFPYVICEVCADSEGDDGGS